MRPPSRLSSSRPVARPGQLAAQEQATADGGGLVGADGGPEDRDAVAPPKLVFAVPLEGADLRVDGLLDDEAWRSARWFSDFRQKEPVEGAEPSERTEVAFVFDDGNLYVGARMHAEDPSTVLAALSRRDDGGSRSDKLIVSLDTYRDLGRHTRSPSPPRESGWTGTIPKTANTSAMRRSIRSGRRRRTSTRWAGPPRCAFLSHSFGSTRRTEQVWGINVNRWIPSNNEDIYWIAVPREQSGWSSEVRRASRPGRSHERPADGNSPYVATEAVVHELGTRVR